MKCIWLSFLAVFLLFSGVGYGVTQRIPGYAATVDSKLIFLLKPQASGGTEGFWQATVISPSGRKFSGPQVACSDLSDVSIVLSQGEESIELGTYCVMLESHMYTRNAVRFLSTISVESSLEGVGSIIFRDLPRLSFGESTMMFVRIFGGDEG